MDILDLYAMAGGIAQIFSGVVFYVRFMHKKVSLWFYLLSVVCGGIFVHVIRGSVTVQMAAYVLLLTICGMLLPKEGDRAERPRIKKAADFQSAVLYAVMVAEVMLLCYGVVKSLWSVFYPLLRAGRQNSRICIYAVGRTDIAFFILALLPYNRTVFFPP